MFRPRASSGHRTGGSARALFLLGALVIICFAGAQACGTDSALPLPPPRPTATPLPGVFRATVSPSSGPPGTELTVAGSGWGPGLPVSITLANGDPDSKPYVTTASDVAGNFLAKFRIERMPDGAPVKPGRLDLLVVGFKGNTTVSFLVEPNGRS